MRKAIWAKEGRIFSGGFHHRTVLGNGSAVTAWVMGIELGPIKGL
jgi:hypothetical protein